MLDSAPTVFLTRVGNTRSSTAPRPRLSGLGQAVARACVQRLTGRRIEIGHACGRPTARWSDGGQRDAPPSLSISYCPGWIAVAISPWGRVGVDIEPSRSVSWRVAERVMSVADAEGFHGMATEDRERAATHCWTAAEALAKADGRGLALMLERVLTLGFASRGKTEGSWDRYGFAATESEAEIVCALAADTGADLEGAVARPTLLELDCLVA